MKLKAIFLSLCLLVPAQTVWTSTASSAKRVVNPRTAKKADPIVGRYKTIDDKTKKALSIVEIYEKKGVIYAKIVKVFGEDANARCEKCKGDKKNKPLKGLGILWGMKNNGDVYSGGTILDPDNGKTYTCKMWLTGNKLKVRGYIAFLYRTQYWHKTK
ncbi:DUF2147 domain-containing protein [Myxococcota bacterium]|nr:DUF2147 domain-containing protein [Myxococcota bacterium]MBU1534083.1 DUF2147 domain-containing protein [Myxococcota bacterium]